MLVILRTIFMIFLDGIKIYCATRGLEKTTATIRGEDLDLRLLCMFLRNIDLSGITEDHVISYLRMMLELGWTANGAYKKSCVFRNFFKFSKMKGWTKFDPSLIPIVKKPVNIPHTATQEQYEKVMAVIPQKGYEHIRNRAIIALLWHTGARNGEICSLDLNLVDLLHRKAIIKTEKSRGRRPLREIFWDAPDDKPQKYLLDWLEAREEILKENHLEDSQAVFIGTPRGVGWKRISNHLVGLMLRKYSKKARVPTLNPHSARHHFAHDLVKKHANNSDIMNLLGHSRLESSLPYTQMYQEELHERYKHFKGCKSSS